jgi:hypothetical protein
MAIIARIEATGVSEYRAYIVGKDGDVASFRTFVSDSDADATVWAKQLVECNDLELWSGDRFVIRLRATSRPGAITYDVRDGQMIPKPAK